MHRTLATALATLVAGALVVTSWVPATATAPGSAQPPEGDSAEPYASPLEALASAESVRRGEGDEGASMTLALRDLWVARPDLGDDERDRADAVLSRPTDDNPGPGGAYTVDSERTCGEHTCVHHVPTTADAPPSRAWVRRSLRAVEASWTRYVDGLGYRAPLRDGSRGGDGRLDVYLVDLGPGLYGYCAPERRRAGRTATGYCVIDNDFGSADYPSGTPTSNLRVTVAHELFHTVQFAYDVREDRWLMEASATWAEERVADAVDDNRQYLPYGQLRHSALPLDLGDTHAYGNWIFFEHLAGRFGDAVVRSVWEQAGSLKKDGRRQSLGALRAVLARRGGLAAHYALFAAGNTVPATTYPEGDAYRAPAPAERFRLAAGHRSVARSTRIDHLASRTFRFVPDSSLANGSRLRLGVVAPGFGRARVVVRAADGTVRQRTVRLTKGRGSLVVRFDRDSTSWVGLTLANTSTRMKCGVTPRTDLSCGGRALDDDARFRLTASALRP
ncbi:MAG: MXAN_6640 family putative metalloprotease [Nocardioides sp.]|uniref:MXAN_6640 family putative metalloprotease n=1 Tax=Nocardioides sp. TaxID=35761 RepID=UPI003F044269